MIDRDSARNDRFGDLDPDGREDVRHTAVREQPDGFEMQPRERLKEIEQLRDR